MLSFVKCSKAFYDLVSGQSVLSGQPAKMAVYLLSNCSSIFQRHAKYYPSSLSYPSPSWNFIYTSPDDDCVLLL